MRRLMLACLLLSLTIPVCWSQQTADKTIALLGQITNTDAGDWRFQHPAQPGGEGLAVDDSQWPLVKPEHQWSGDNTAAWYRQLIVVPQTLGGASPAGSRLVLRCGVDDDGEVYLNGTLAGRFHWDQGKVALTDNAKPGDKFLVAIKAINQGGPGRLLFASLTYDKFADMREAADQCRVRLEFCRRLLDAKRIAARRAEYAKALDAAAAAIDFGAVEKRDKPAFEASLKASVEALKPFSDLAKQFSLYLVGHAHIDMNWLWLWPETKEVCRATWTQALKFMEEFPEFRFSQSQPGAYLAIEQEYPELFKQIQAAVKAGKWEPTGAGWVENDMNMPSGEALARHCLLTNAYYTEKFGRGSDTAWAPDTFGHAWTVPSILSDAGYKHYYFCRCGKGYPLFWWEGPDGSRLLADNLGSYGEQVRPDRAGWALDTDNLLGVPQAMVIYGVGDHGGGPTREDLTWATKLQQEPMFPKVQFATTDDYFGAVEKQPGTRIPVVKDELNFIFQGCYTTHADIKRWNRELENILPTAESLAAIASNWGAPYPQDSFTQAWRNTLFNQFHDIFDGSAIHGSYEYSGQLASQALKIADDSVNQSLETLAAKIDTRRVDTSRPGLPTLKQDLPAVLVWNPVAWVREDYVEATIPTASKWAGAKATFSRFVPNAASEGLNYSGLSTGPAQVIASDPDGEGFRTTVGFIASLPAMGYQVYHLVEAEAPEGEDAGSFTLQTGERLQGSYTGTKLGLAQQSGLPGAEGLAKLQMLHEAPGGMSAWNLGPIAKTEDLDKVVSIRTLAAGPVCQRMAITRKWGKSTLVETVAGYDGLERLDFDLDVDWQETGNATDGGPFLKAAFELPVQNPRATFEIPWGSIERATDGQEVPAQKWIDLAETERVQTPDTREAKAIDVAKYFNLDAIATLDAPGEGDFDKGQRAIGSEIFAAAKAGVLTCEGVPFLVPPTTAGALNAIECHGQTLEWPAEQCPALAVLGSASNGAQTGMARLLYADGSEDSVQLAFSDWCVGSGAGEVTAAELSYRLDAATGKQEIANRLFMRKLDANPKQALRGIILPDQPNLKVLGLAFAAKTQVRDVWGVSLLNDCKYGFDVKGNVMRMSLLRASYDPDPTPDQGKHHIRWSLVPHKGDWRSANIPRRALEFNCPPIVRVVSSHQGTLPPDYSFVSVEPQEMVLSAFKRAEDGKGYVARVYNSQGVGGEAKVVCNLNFGQAAACNLLEQPRAANSATMTGPEVTLPLQGKLHGTVRLQ